MTGEQIFNEITRKAEKAGRRSTEAEYLQTLRTAYMLVGPNELYQLLETAARTGQVIDLTYPIDPEVAPSDPNGVKLISA